MAVTVKPTDADFEQACVRLCFKRWSDLKAKAREIAAERMIEASHRETGEIISKLNSDPRPTGIEWRKLQDRLDKIWADSDALLRIAYPSTYKDGT